jgi:hypothetical protein
MACLCEASVTDFPAKIPLLLESRGAYVLRPNFKKLLFNNYNSDSFEIKNKKLLKIYYKNFIIRFIF